jgi:hypothetical protein
MTDASWGAIAAPSPLSSLSPLGAHPARRRTVLLGSRGHDVLYGGQGRDGFVVFPHDSRPDFDPGQDFLIHLPAKVRVLMAD